MCQALSRWLDTLVNKPDGDPWPWNFHFQWREAPTEWTDSEEYRVREIWHLGKNLPFSTSPPPYCYTSPEEIAGKQMLSKVYIILPFIIFMCMVTATCTSGGSDSFQLCFKSSDLLHNCMFKSSQKREEFIKNVKDHHRKKNSTICLSNLTTSSVNPYSRLELLWFLGDNLQSLYPWCHKNDVLKPLSFKASHLQIRRKLMY